MTLIRPAAAAEFLALVRAFLARHEVENGIIIGVAEELARMPRTPRDVYLAAVMDDGEPVAAALRTSQKLLLSRESRGGATSELAVDALRSGAAAVLGPAAEVETFARAATAATKVTWRPGRRSRIYDLHRVIPAAPTSGSWRVGHSRDRDMLTQWTLEFTEEAVETPDAREVILERVERRIGQGCYYLWSDRGTEVSMAAAIGPTPNGIRIGGVYTPPAFRGRGYATALVAAASRHLLDGGRKFVYLYTDLANPTSNRIYQRIGYAPVADPLELWVDAER